MTLSLQGDRPRDTPKRLSTCSARLLPIGLTVRFRALTVLEPCTLLALSGRSLERLVQPVLRATVHVETGQAAPPASAVRAVPAGPRGWPAVGGVGTLSTGPSRETGVEVCLLHVGMLRLGVHNVPGHAKGETLSAGVAGTRPQPGSALGPAHQFRLARE